MIETILLIGYSIYAFIQAIRVTKNVAYIHILGGIVLGLIANICISVASFYTIASDVVVVYIIIANISIGLSLLAIFNGMIMIREDKLPIFSYMAALIAGATIILVSSIENSQLQYDFNAIWSVKYDNVMIPIMTGISTLVLISYFVINTIRNIRKLKHNKWIDLSLVAFLLLVFWIIAAFIDSIKVVRMFILPIVYFLLGLTLLGNPLGLLATNILPEEIILVNRFSQPLIRIDLKEEKIVRKLEEVQLLLAGKKVISDSLKTSELPETLKMKTKEIKTVDGEDFSCIVIGRKIDRNCISATNVALGEFSNKANLEYLDSTSVLNEKDEKLFVEIFLASFKRIDATKK